MPSPDHSASRRPHRRALRAARGQARRRALRAVRGRALMAARGRALMAARGCALAAVLGAAGLLAVTGCAAEQAAQTSPASSAAVANPNLDLGTSMHGVPAPDIRLVNQFGQPMALSQFRGKVVILAFVDSQCTTVCPLTTSSMVDVTQRACMPLPLNAARV